MVLATDYCVAHRTLAPAVLFAGTANLPHAKLPGIDPTRLARLLGILSRRGRPHGGPTKCRLLTDAALDHCVLLVAPNMVAMVAAASPEAEAVAEEWAAAGPATGSAWMRHGVAPALTAETAIEALRSLIDLAQVARASRTDLLLRLSLAR
jgi:hypothetical protein